MTLDVLARQFAVKYDHKAICVNYKEEWEKSKAAALSQKSKTRRTKKRKRRMIQVSVMYLRISSRIIPTRRERLIKRRRYRIMTDRSNRFSHKGMLKTIRNYANLNKNKLVKITFSEFKAKLN